MSFLFTLASIRWHMARNGIRLLRVLKLFYFRLFINRRKQLLAIICIFCLMNGAWDTVCRSHISAPLSKEAIMGASKCPACAGNSFCTAVLNGFSFDCLAYVFSTSPVEAYLGFYAEEKVLLEKLGNTNMIETMERTLCILIGKGSSECNVTDATSKAELDDELNSLLNLTVGISTLTACPTKRLIERIADKYLEKFDPVKLKPLEQIQLLATLLLNPEPIVFQTFSQYDRFPFRLYVGACGSHMVTRIQGEPLRSFYSASWLVRLRIALHLLKTAVMFTENETRFALYWTDVSFETFTYSSTSDMLYVTNGKHVIVVDKLAIEENHPVGWDAPIYSQFQNCSDNCSRHCPLIIPNGLCSAATADHNYYAICRNLLSSYACQPGGYRRGFLYDIPPDVEEFFPIRALLNECARPSTTGIREELVLRLIDILQLTIQSKSFL